MAGILKLWVSSLPEPVIPSRLHAAAVATVANHGSKDEQVAALHGLLRQCEHRVLQVLFPLMEVRLHHGYPSPRITLGTTCVCDAVMRSHNRKYRQMELQTLLIVASAITLSLPGTFAHKWDIAATDRCAV